MKWNELISEFPKTTVPIFIHDGRLFYPGLQLKSGYFCRETVETFKLTVKCLTFKQLWREANR